MRLFFCAHSSFWPPSLLALFAYWWQSVGIICITGDGHYPWVHAAWAAKACWICALDSVRCVWLQTHVIFLLLDRSLADMRPDSDWYERKYWAWSLTSALEALEGQNSGYDESEWVDSLQESCVQNTSFCNKLQRILLGLMSSVSDKIVLFIEGWCLQCFIHPLLMMTQHELLFVHFFNDCSYLYKLTHMLSLWTIYTFLILKCVCVCVQYSNMHVCVSN